MNKKVAVIGNGWVGKAMQELFPDSITYVRDINKAIQEGKILQDLYDEGRYTEKKEVINEADFAFICVPTPNLITSSRGDVDKYQHSDSGEGKLDVSAIDEILEWCEAKTIIIRSTVNPGDIDAWCVKYNKWILFQPEYLGETPQHPLLDTVKTPFLIIGGHPVKRTELIELYTTVYNANVKIRQVTSLEAEIIKLSENRAIAFKVAECQELYDACRRAGVDYYTVRDAVYGDDPRFNLWWTFVYPENRGFNSKCIPKDIYAWAAWAESMGYEPKLTRAMLEKNKEWING